MSSLRSTICDNTATESANNVGQPLLLERSPKFFDTSRRSNVVANEGAQTHRDFQALSARRYYSRNICCISHGANVAPSGGRSTGISTGDLLGDLLTASITSIRSETRTNRRAAAAGSVKQRCQWPGTSLTGHMLPSLPSRYSGSDWRRICVSGCMICSAGIRRRRCAGPLATASIGSEDKRDAR